MQNTKMSTGEYVLFSIPVEMLEEAGIGEESVVQMSAGNGKIIINTIRIQKILSAMATANTAL